MSRVNLGEVTIGYDDEGGGEALVLVHGHPFNRSMWWPQAERFSRKGCRVIVPDLRGYGESTVVAGTTPLSAFAGDLAALLDHLGIARCTLGGLSMGGQIVMECYRSFPDRVRGLLFADTFAEPETPAGKVARNEVADRLLRDGMADYAEEVLPKMVAYRTITAQPQVAAHVLAMMRGTPPAGAAAALRGRAERPDYRDTLATVTVPTLVVVGNEDEYTPVRDAQTVYDLVPGATLEVIAGAGHLPNLERTGEFNAVLGRFLAGLPTPA